MDILTKSERSKRMRSVKGRGNKSTEVSLITIFKELGVTGWRRHQRLVGQPDFVFPKRRLVIFVDGCFWHGCPLHYTRPKTNQKFWDEKRMMNMERDRRLTRLLKKKGWNVIRIWEHELRPKVKSANSINLRRLMKLLESKDADGGA